METPATQRTRGRRRIIQEEESASEQEVQKDSGKKSSNKSQKPNAKSQKESQASESQYESLEEAEDSSVTRRKLRKNYRIEIDRIEGFFLESYQSDYVEQKQELVSPFSKGLKQVIKRSNKLYQKGKHQISV